jgi:hypothetical protein
MLSAAIAVARRRGGNQEAVSFMIAFHAPAPERRFRL